MDASAWIAIVAAVITVLSTKAAMAQAAESKRQTELQRRIHEDSFQPYVWADITPDTVQGSLLKLVVCNEGPTVATNVHLTFNPPLADIVEYRNMDKVQESLAAGISSLAPKRQIQWVLGVAHAFFDQRPVPTIEISVTCDGPYGPCPLSTHVMNLEYIRHSHDYPEGSLHRVAERIKELTKAVESIDSRTGK